MSLLFSAQCLSLSTDVKVRSLCGRSYVDKKCPRNCAPFEVEFDLEQAILNA